MPLILERLYIVDTERNMERVWLLWSDASVLAKVCLVQVDQDISKFRPFEHKKVIAILVGVFECNQNANQARKWFVEALPENLMLAIFGHSDIRELADIELPVQSGDGLHLDGNVLTRLARRDYVVMRDIARKWSCQNIATAEFRCHKEFSNCTCQLSVSAYHRKSNLATKGGLRSAMRVY